MDKFTLQHHKASDPIDGFYLVSHNVAPLCEIEIFDLNVLSAREALDDLPSRDFRHVEPDGTIYQVDICVYEMLEEGAYDQVLKDCWNWWLSLQIRSNALLELSGN